MEIEVKDAEVVSPSFFPKEEDMEEVKEIKNSPLPFLTFPEAMREVLEGKKVTRKEWDDNESYGYLNDGFLMVKKSEDKKDYQWIVSEADMKAVDWLII